MDFPALYTCDFLQNYKILIKIKGEMIKDNLDQLLDIRLLGSDWDFLNDFGDL